MGPVARCSVALLALTVSAGCSSRSTEQGELDEMFAQLEDFDMPSGVVDREAADELIALFDPPAPAAGALTSALDSVTEAAGYDDSERRLVSLAPTPSAFGGFRLANVQVDDPNDDGTIADRWYEPRVRRSECSTTVDTPPGPFVIASYLPGQTYEQFEGTDPTAALELMSSPVAIGVQIQVFDTAAQRDGARDAMLDFYRSPTFECGDNPTMSVTQYVERTDPTGGRQDATFVIESPMTLVPTSQTMSWAHERVLLTVSVATVEADGGWDDAMIDRWLEPALDAALARLDAASLPELPG